MRIPVIQLSACAAETLTSIVRYVDAFGASTSLRLWWKLGRASLLAHDVAKPAPTALYVPRLRRNLWLRPGTSDLAVLKQMFVTGEYSIDWSAHGRRLVVVYDNMVAQGKTPLIVDCGANIGLSTLWFAERFPNARIIAIEPDADNFSLLERNTDGLPNLIALRGGVWNVHSELIVLNTNVPAWSYRLGSAPTTQGQAASRHTVQGFTVQEIMQMASASDIFIAKIDIEGGEATLFRGDTSWLARTSMLAIELHDWLLPGQRSSGSFFHAISNYPFEYVQQGENLMCFRMTALDGLDT